MSVYQAAHRRGCCTAITALGNRIGLYAGGTRVGTVFADTTWAAPVDVTESGVDKAQSTGSTVSINIPGGTVANGTVIDRYAVFSGSTLLRTEVLPVSLTVNDGSLAVVVDITPVFKYHGL